jgi:hypothetical protein
MGFFENKQIWTEITLSSGRRGHVMHDFLSINGETFIATIFKFFLILLVSSIAILLLPAILILFFYKFKRYYRFLIGMYSVITYMYFLMDIKKHIVSKLLFFGWTSDDGTINNGIFSMETLELFRTINTYALGLAFGFFIDFLLYKAFNKKLNLDDLYTQKPALKWVTMIGIYLVTMFAVTNLIL